MRGEIACDVRRALDRVARVSSVLDEMEPRGLRLAMPAVRRGVKQTSALGAAYRRASARGGNPFQASTSGADYSTALGGTGHIGVE